MKILTIILLVSISCFDLVSQNYKQIDSVRFELQMIQSEPAYLLYIKYVTKTDSIKYVTDTIFLNDKVNLKKFKYYSQLSDNITIATTVEYSNLGLYYSKTDSISQYFPLKSHIKLAIPNWNDTLEAVVFSEILTKLKEPILSNTDLKFNILRLTIDHNDYHKIIRIEDHNDSVILYTKITHFQSLSLVEHSEMIHLNTYNEIFKQIKNTIESLDKDSTIIGNDILIELLIEGKYQYFKINSYNIHWNNKECKNIRQLLKLIANLESNKNAE